jgi:hypothetical protein
MSEKSESRRDGARLVKNSGRGQVKGDATWKDFVVDYKEYGKSFSINQDAWAKICTDAMKNDRNKSPLLKLIIGTGQKKVRLAVIEFAVLEDMVERLEQLDGSG